MVSSSDVGDIGVSGVLLCLSALMVFGVGGAGSVDLAGVLLCLSGVGGVFVSGVIVCL